MTSYMALVTRLTPSSYGGYDHDFVSQPPDRLVCKICHFPSRNPYLSVCCGHLFCKSCLDNVEAVAITDVCPVCRDEEFVTFPNKAVDREVKSLCMHCTNKKNGCEWQGELNDIDHHRRSIDGCQFEEVKCSNECGKAIQRQYLTSHVETECPRREVICQYCHDTGEYQFMEGQHKEECPKLPLPCPNKCEFAFILREDMEAHRRQCRLEIVKCLKKCGKQLERQCLTAHMETECSNRTVECPHCYILGPHGQITGPQHRKLCSKLPLPCPNKCGVEGVPREDMEAHRKECPLEMIQCEYHSVGCDVRVARKDKEIHDNEMVKEHLMMTKQGLSKLDDIRHELTDTKAQLAAAVKQTTNLTTVLMNARLGLNTRAVLTNIRSVHLDSMVTAFKCGNQACPVTIKMSEYSNYKEDEVEWYSHSFYAHSKGYKMCLRIDAGGLGDGMGTHLSVFLYLMKGPHDDELTWPLRGKFEIKLLNQIMDNEHYSVTMTHDYTTPIAGNEKNGRGETKFISNESLNEITPACQYLKDDCLFFQVTKLSYTYTL